MEQIVELDQKGQTLAAVLGIVDSPEPFSDVLVCIGEPVMVRDASGWSPYKSEPFSQADIEYILETMDPDWAELLKKGGFSRPFVAGNWRLRITAYLAMRGNKQMLAIRRTPVDPISLPNTGLPKQIALMVENPSGLVLISGATGAGKSTTMAALVDALNQVRNVHIETIEDPIEFVFKPNKAVFSQREVGPDTPSFFEGVRGAMRQRPDVIVIGEIRDRDTAENAILAGESGHLVIATLHASSAFGAIQKLLSFFPGEEASKLVSLSTSLMGVIHQAVVPGIGDEKAKGVVAAELMFNHEQQFSKYLGNAVDFNNELANTGGVSCSMAHSLAVLVAEKKITKGNAIRTVAGQAMAVKKLEEALKKQNV